MKKEQIQEIISNYNSLIHLTEQKIDVMKNIHDKYSTKNGIELISFEDTHTIVKCDNSCMGCYDEHYFSFPISFLSLSNQELITVVEQELHNDLINEQQQKKEKEKQNLEQQWKQYVELKNKFES